VRANWDSAFAAAVTYVGASPRPTDLQFFRRLRRWGALLDDGQLEILPPGTIAGRVARPPLILRSIEHRPFIMDYAINDEMRVARPERLAEILAVQGIPAATWIRDSVLPEISAATEASRWERAVAAMLEGERGTRRASAAAAPRRRGTGRERHAQRTAHGAIGARAAAGGTRSRHARGRGDLDTGELICRSRCGPRCSIARSETLPARGHGIAV